MKTTMERFNSWKDTPIRISSTHSFSDVIKKKDASIFAVSLICDGGCVTGGGSGGDGDGGSCSGE